MSSSIGEAKCRVTYAASLPTAVISQVKRLVRQSLHYAAIISTMQAQTFKRASNTICLAHYQTD
jgi:hypothetical protein